VAADDQPQISKRGKKSQTTRRKFQNDVRDPGFTAATFKTPPGIPDMTNQNSFNKSEVSDLTNNMSFIKSGNVLLINQYSGGLPAASSTISGMPFAISAAADLTFISLFGLLLVADYLNYSDLTKYLFS
jgi:hypothetical protein